MASCHGEGTPGGKKEKHLLEAVAEPQENGADTDSDPPGWVPRWQARAPEGQVPF